MQFEVTEVYHPTEGDIGRRTGSKEGIEGLARIAAECAAGPTPPRRPGPPPPVTWYLSRTRQAQRRPALTPHKRTNLLSSRLKSLQQLDRLPPAQLLLHLLLPLLLQQLLEQRLLMQALPELFLLCSRKEQLLHALLPSSLEQQELFHALQLPQQQQLLHPLLPAHPLLHPWLEPLL